MNRRDWWLGVAVLAAVLLLHALVPRYEWQHQEGLAWLRVDRWSGRAEPVIVSPRLAQTLPDR